MPKPHTHLVAVDIGLRVLGLSILTNLCLPDGSEPTTGENVVSVAESAEVHLRKIVCGVLAEEAARSNEPR